MTNSKKQSPALTNANPNYWAMPRKELVENLLHADKVKTLLNERITEMDRLHGMLDKSMAQTDQSSKNFNSMLALVKQSFRLMGKAEKEIAKLKSQLETAPQNTVEIGLIRLARHTPPNLLINALCRVIEMAAFHSDIDIDSTEKENFLPLLEIRDVFKGQSCYSLS